jgi:hypothetical protein
MLNPLRVSKERITFFTLVLTGLFLISVGTPLASSSITYVNTNTTVYPHFTLGAPLIALGFIMLLVGLKSQEITMRKAQVIIGLSGQALVGIVILGMPLVPCTYSLPYSYPVILGTIGIALSSVSIIMISSYDKKQNLLNPK